MGFESGSVSCRMFYVQGRMPEDCVKRFAAHAAPPIDTVGSDPVSGWVSGRHLLDRKITDENATVAGYLRLTLVSAQRKVPEALLRAECQMEELAEMQARGTAFLKRDARMEIRKNVLDRLLPAMPPTLKGMPMVHDAQNDLVYAAAMSDKQSDALILAVREAVGVTLIPLTPATAALRRKQVNARDLDPSSFSPEFEDEQSSDSLGQDFLTWLWFFAEMRGGLVKTDRQEFGVILEGPLTFVLEGNGAYETVLRKGTPLVSAEAKTALLSGKKLKSARVTLARGEEMWSVRLDGDEFLFRGLAMPKGAQLDPISRFQERMLLLETFREAFLQCYDIFLGERANASAWKKTVKEIHGWVANRVAKC